MVRKIKIYLNYDGIVLYKIFYKYADFWVSKKFLIFFIFPYPNLMLNYTIFYERYIKGHNLI